MGEFAGLEITIKDSKRFADEPGNFPTGACNTCHQNSAADDFVFTQYYPVLRAAKASRSGRVMTSESEDFLGDRDGDEERDR